MTAPVQQSNPVPPRAGRATITLRDGRVYVAERAELRGHRLTFTGRLRIRDASGVRLYPPREHSVTLRKIRRIDWHEERP